MRRKTIPSVREPTALPVESNPSNVVTVKTLRDVRENAMRQRVDLSKTIAELTELADEINSTLALLRAQRGDK